MPPLRRLVCVGALLAFQHWLQATGRTPALYSLKNQVLFPVLANPRVLLPGLAKHVGTALLYLGWFSLPVTVLAIPGLAVLRRNRRAFAVGCLAGCAYMLCAVVTLVLTRGPMPTAGNIVLPQGMGPLSLRDVHLLNLPHLPSLGKAFWLVVTAASLLGGALLVGGAAGKAMTLWPSLKPARIAPDRTAGIFFLLCAGIYLGPILVIGGWDRYYLPALPFLLVGIAAIGARTFLSAASEEEQAGAAGSEVAAPTERSCGQECPRSGLGQVSRHRPGGARVALSVLLLAGLSVYAVLGTRDYLAWNRVRWAALNELLAGGKVAPAEVDGGFEFDGWYLYGSAYKEDSAEDWYRADRGSYLLAFAEMPGWVVVKQYPYTHWLPPYTGQIVVLKR